MKNIVLIGFMGSGKSSVACSLAEKLKMDCVETDTLALKESGRKSISEIFAIDGEITFRELELKVAKKISKKRNIIVSTGGGMVINKLCIDYLRKKSVVIYLETSFDEIAKRLVNDNSRPLFANKDVAQKLFQFRKQLYTEYADITVATDGVSVDAITNIILEKV